MTMHHPAIYCALNPHFVTQGKRRRTANSRFDSYVRLPERDQHWPRAEGPLEAPVQGTLGAPPAPATRTLPLAGRLPWQQAPQAQQQFKPPDAYKLDDNSSDNSLSAGMESNDDAHALVRPKGARGHPQVHCIPSCSIVLLLYLTPLFGMWQSRLY